jgi:TctA family transporter
MLVVIKSGTRPFLTLLGLLLTGLYGYSLFHNPGMVGKTYQITPLLVGLFGIPIALGVLLDPDVSDNVRDGVRWQLLVDPWIGLKGALVGCFTGFFAGIGSASVTAIAFDAIKEEVTEELDEETCEKINTQIYVCLGSASSFANDYMALLLMLTVGMGRSGEAIALGRSLTGAGGWVAPMAILCIIYGAAAGRAVVTRYQKQYGTLVRKVKPKVLVTITLIISCIPVVLAGGWSIGGQLTVWSYCLCGWLLSTWCRHNYLPNQVAFGAFTIPLVAGGLGLVPWLNSWLF